MFKALMLEKDGAGRMYYRIGLRYAPKDLKLAAADYGFTVQRGYEAVDDPKDVTRDKDGVWHVTTTVWMADMDVSPNFVGTKIYPSAAGKTFEYTLQGDPLNPDDGAWSGASRFGRFAHPGRIWYPEPNVRNTERDLVSPGLDRQTIANILAGSDGSDITPTPTPTAILSPSATFTPTAASTPTPAPTSAATMTPAPTVKPSLTPTPSPAATPRVTPTRVPRRP